MFNYKKNVLYNNSFNIFLIFYKQNWVTLCKSQIYSMPEIFFLSPDSRDQRVAEYFCPDYWPFWTPVTVHWAEGKRLGKRWRIESGENIGVKQESRQDVKGCQGLSSSLGWRNESEERTGMKGREWRKPYWKVIWESWCTKTTPRLTLRVTRGKLWGLHLFFFF